MSQFDWEGLDDEGIVALTGELIGLRRQAGIERLIQLLDDAIKSAGLRALDDPKADLRFERGRVAGLRWLRDVFMLADVEYTAAQERLRPVPDAEHVFTDDGPL